MRDNEIKTRHSGAKYLYWALVFLTLVLISAQADAQTFTASGVGSTVIASEHTAVVGKIVLTLSGGSTTGAGTIFVTYGGVPITNAAATDIQITDTFASHASISSVDFTDGIVAINIPAAVNGTVSLDGVRLDIAAAGVSSVTALISASQGSGFTIAAGSSQVVVVNTVLPGLIVQNSESIITIQPGATQTTSGQFTIQEGFMNAFSSAIGTFGQNVATQIKLLVKGLPAGVTITFPATIDASTGGGSSLTASTDLALPTSTGDTSITYQYSEVVSPVARSFPITYQVNIASPLSDTAVISIQATLFPSDAPAIPRYATVYVPCDSDLPYPEFDSALPVLLDNDYFFGLAFTNPNNFDIPFSLTAYDMAGNIAAGSNVTNPFSTTIPAGKQISGLLEDFFGSGIRNVNPGTVFVASKHAKAIALYLTGNDQNTDLGGGSIPSCVAHFIIPFVSIGNPTTRTNVGIFNPLANSEATVTLTVHDTQGNSVASQLIPLGPRETISGELSQIMGQDLSGVSSGYIEGSATLPGAHTTVIYGDNSEINIVGARGLSFVQTRWIPHFIAGGGYDTEIDLVNMDTTYSPTVQFTLFGDDGQVLAGTAATSITIAPLGKKTIAVSSLLGFNSGQLMSGSIRIDVQPIYMGPFAITVNVEGGVRFYSTSMAGYSTVVPIDLAMQTSTIYPHVAQTLGYFTGLAVMNPNNASVTVTVDVFDKNGVKVGSDTFPLAPQSRISKLLYQMVPQSAGQQDGYFRVSATGYVSSFALFGDTSARFLAAIPSQ